MRFQTLVLVMLTLLSSQPVAAQSRNDLPSCDLQTQRHLVGNTSGNLTDIRHAHISARANVLDADISTSQKARRMTEASADYLFKRVEEIRKQSGSFVKQQGFLSAAEKASFDREFDAIAGQLCE